jgi:signal transduction histidine kinase
MLAFALVVAIGLSAVVLVANQVATRELRPFMMQADGGTGAGMMNGGRGPGPAAAPGQLQQSVLDRVNQAIVLGGLLALIAALVIGFVVFRVITRPVEQLTTAAQSLTQGELTARVEVDDHPARLGRDELSELGLAFNSMADHLQQAERLRRDMTADIAHELRTPLSVIRANLEAMIDGVYPLDAEHLGASLDQVNLLSRLIEDLRTLALAEAGQLPLLKRATDLTELITNTLTSFKTQAAAQHVTLIPAVAKDLPQVEVDPDRIQQTIAILITNALRHTPEEGSITVRAQPANDRVSIEVADTGSGIAPEDLPHIFERFYRADKSRSRAGGGSGLGLAIAKGIVEAHGGSILATSKLSEGTTMRVELPV